MSSAEDPDSRSTAANLGFVEKLFGPSRGWSLAPVATWLLTDGRLMTDARELVTALIARLETAGARIDRLRISSSTLHPQLAALGVSWSRGQEVQLWTGQHGVLNTEAYIGSPMQFVHENRQPLHRSIDMQTDPEEHAIWQEMRAEGLRDYLALPMVMSNDSVSAITIATRDAAGFDGDDVARFTALANLLIPQVELLVALRTTLDLLDTFVGKRISGRILQGQVKRGDGEKISAAFWYSDLRGFTALSESLPTDQLLKLLNDYYEYCAAAAASRGGEILQFIGDAILIVFEIKDPARTADVCKAALDAAIDAFDTIAVVNNRRRRARQPVVEFGLGLHLGTVTHANVGAPNRLAFNVVGPPVNMTARIQSKTKKLGIPLLMSSDFARLVDLPITSVGLQELRGIATPQELFRLAEQ